MTCKHNLNGDAYTCKNCGISWHTVQVREPREGTRLVDKKFTPGPWKAELTKRGQAIWAGSYLVAIVGQCSSRPEHAQNDAALIASAPEMLEALIEMVELVKRIIQKEDWGAIEEYHDEALAVIEKALGSEAP